MRPLLGTYVVIEAVAGDDDTALYAIDAGFSAIETVQQLMSAFDPASDVSRINECAHIETVTVHPWTAEVLELAAAIHTDSDGLFDIGVAPRLAQWNMLPTSVMDYSESSATKLVIDHQSVRSTAPTRIDLGGIAKGYAVDRAIEAALAAGAMSVLVNAGGDLRVAGEAEEPVYVRDPRHPQHIALAGTLRDGAIATSGIYFSKRRHDDKPVSAIVEPSSGLPLLDDLSFTVIAPSCAIADALTKVFALSGDPHHPAFANHHAQAVSLPTS